VPNANTLKGRRAEWRCRDALDAGGYYVIRAAGSLGNADLVALAKSYVAVVQVKATERADSKEWNDLFRLGCALDAAAIWATVLPRKPIRWEQITGERQERSRVRPSEEWLM
jgi:Holliday junction resolvase